jgi:outer-membrane receptor for ferric coprogen and ferric-rhodotorulic acid
MIGEPRKFPAWIEWYELRQPRIVKLKAPATILWSFFVAAGCAPGLICAAPSAEPAKYDIKIDSQPLGTALQALAKQSGVQIIFFSQITEGLRAPALEGQFTVSTALELLLARSRLTFRVINPKTIEIRALSADSSQSQQDAPAGKGGQARAPADPHQSPGGKTAAKNSVALDEIVVNSTAEGLVATRTETPLREIPQTISLISQEQMRQQNDTDLADALNNAVGITVVRNNSLSSTLISRGFTITTFHLDGGAALNSFSNTPVYGSPDLGEYDHVEVLRGSDALFGGIGNPGASVNMVRKRPLATDEALFSAYAGSWNNTRAEADVTGPLGFDGALRARLDVVFGDKDYFFKPASLERKKVFGVLECDLTTQTLLTVGGSYQWDNAVPFVIGLPLYADGSDAHLPRSMALAFNWSRYDTQTREYYAQLQQSLGGKWKLRLNATSLDAAANYGYGGFDSPIDPITKALPIRPFAFFSPSPNTQDQFAFDGTLTGSFDLFGRRIDVAVGGDYTHFKGDVSLQATLAFGPALNNVFMFNPGAYPDPPVPFPASLRSLATTNQSGEFASARVYLTDALSVVGGARVSSNRLSNALSSGLAPLITEETKDDDKVTPFVGATYDLNAHYSLYASYADIYQTNNGVRKIGGALLPPADGIDRELGIKGSWRDGALNGFFVLYDIEQRALAVPDLSASFADELAYSPCCFLSTGTNKSKGLDAELDGALAPGWLIGAGYTFNINHGLERGDLSTATPRHLLKLWSSRELTGELAHWTIGGSVQGQSSNFADGIICAQLNSLGNCVGTQQQPTRAVQGPFVVINLRASYEIDAHWRAALSVNNVFDRIYYQTIGTPAGGNWYGEPRGFVLRVDGRY